MCAKRCTKSNDQQNIVSCCSHISVGCMTSWIEFFAVMMMTSPDLTNVVWVKTILTNMNVQKSYRHIWPKKVKYPIPEIPDDSEKKSGTDWVLPKIIGSGRVSGTRQALTAVLMTTLPTTGLMWSNLLFNMMSASGLRMWQPSVFYTGPPLKC